MPNAFQLKGIKDNIITFCELVQKYSSQLVMVDGERKAFKENKNFRWTKQPELRYKNQNGSPS